MMSPLNNNKGPYSEFVRYEHCRTAAVSLPVVDIGPLYTDDLAAIDSVAEQMGLAAMDSGFLYIENHPISQTLIDDVYGFAERFFSLDYQEKLRYYIGDSPNHRGFVPVTEKGDYDDEPSQRAYEAFDMSVDMPYSDYLKCGPHPLAGPNVWPELNGFRECLSRYFTAIRQLGNRLCNAFEIALDLPPGFFVRHMQFPTSQLRLIHYIPQARPQRNVNMGAHTDYECFTILHTRQSGLQILDKNDEWIEAPLIDGAYAVNIGDLMEAWTNGRFVATAHRVVTDGSERFSMPFFVSTDYGAVIKPLTTHGSGIANDRYKPFIAGEHLMGQLLRDFPYLKKRYNNGDFSLRAGLPRGNPFERRIAATAQKQRGLVEATC